MHLLDAGGARAASGRLVRQLAGEREPGGQGWGPVSMSKAVLIISISQRAHCVLHTASS